ncbi:MAG: pyridoxal-phosphate dependent enzyme [Planctomycetota bacterium]
MDQDDELTTIDIGAAYLRLREAMRVTRLVPFPSGDERVELRLKLEHEQETNAFKARGAWNNLLALTAAERAAGVVACSSGNHGGALAWAAAQHGVRATIFMTENTYPNKIERCRAFGAEVVLAPTRRAAEALCAEAVAAGARLVHPYKDARTIEGAGTLGWELFEQWPEVDVVLIPTGGGGLLAGTSLALAQRSGGRVSTIGVEPTGARSLALSLAAGEPIVLDEITTVVQGLCPPDTGELNVRIVREHASVTDVDDEAILAAQAELVASGHDVEPAGAAGLAAFRAGRTAELLTAERTPQNPLRIACVVTGANPDPNQLAAVKARVTTSA